MSDDLDALEFGEPSPEAAVTVTPSKPRRHRHEWTAMMAQHDGRRADPLGWMCMVCGAIRDPERSRRARTNRSRGLAIQRRRNAELGITNIAGNAPNHDGGTVDDLFVSESKSGASFSERYWRWLSGIPRRAGQVPILIVTETPGRGRRARSIVVVSYDDWVDLHGGRK